MTSERPNNKELFEKYQETRSIELRNKIVEKYLYIVDILIKKYLNKGVDYEDLYQVGSMALVFAVERYDVSKGYEFTSFATPTIIGEIKRYFRDKGWAVKVPRRLKEISAQIPPAKEYLYGKLNRTPTIKELSEYLGYTEEEILRRWKADKLIVHIPLIRLLMKVEKREKAPFWRSILAEKNQDTTVLKMRN